MPEIRVGIGTPDNGLWTGDSAHSIVGMVNHLKSVDAKAEDGEAVTFDVVPIFVTGSMLLAQRHKIVQDAIAAEVTHLVWMDADMRLPKEALIRLLSHNKDIVGINYPRRTPPFTPTAAVNREAVYTEGQGLEAVDHLGFGLLLTHIDVYKDIDWPFFWFDPDPDEPMRIIGEDVGFCRKLRDAGHTIWCDHELSELCQHIAQIPITHRMARAGR